MKLFCEKCDIEETVHTLDLSADVTPSCPQCGTPFSCDEEYSSEIKTRVDEQQQANGGEPETRDFEHPQRVGRYRIVSHIATGGFGSVYKGYDGVLKRHVAIKIPKTRDKQSLDPAIAKAFVAEAQTVAQLEHNNIVPIYDAAYDESSGAAYIVMKWIDGLTLYQFAKQNQLSFEQSAEIVATVAKALHFAHKKGFVHRDLKPGNILIDQDGVPFVTDFGLAINEDEQDQVWGQVAGTPAYMSPEQLQGKSQYLDGRSDVWSLGVIFYELLCSKRPFRGDNLTLKVLEQDPKPLTQIDDSIPIFFSDLCAKCLRKSVDQRFSSCHNIANELAIYKKTGASPHRAAKALSPPLKKILIGTLVAFAGLFTAYTIFLIYQSPSDFASYEVLHPLDPSDTEHFLTDRNHLVVQSPGISIIKIGETSESDFDLSMTFQQAELRGGVGFFVGLDTVTKKYQQILIENFDRDGIRVYRKICSYPISIAVVNGPSELSADVSESIDQSRVIRITLVVRARRIADVNVNGTSLGTVMPVSHHEFQPNLMDPRCNGTYGIYMNGSSATFTNFSIIDLP